MKEIILIAIASTWFTTMSNIPQTIKYYLKKLNIWYLTDEYGVHVARRIKPFDCEKCLSFWLTIIYCWSLHYELLYVLLYATCASSISLLISKIYNHDFAKSI